MPSRAETRKNKKKIRYAVVGLGHIAQVAILPAFKNAKKTSELTALVSGDPVKLKKLSRKHGVERVYSYEEYDECLESGEVDAVFIALPNSMHREYTVRAAWKGIHVLCEKPMAVTEDECLEMTRAVEEGGVKLMIAYRLHFEEANMKAVEIARSGKLGDVRLFSSVFTMQVKEGDIRVEEELGGGTLYDIGIYCINAAKYLFRDEPIEAFAASANKGERRFEEVDEMTSAILRFPGERLAAFTTSFGGAKVSSYQIVGTEGSLRVDPAYGYAVELKHTLEIGGKTRERTFPKRDQFAAEIIYFSNCILEDREPEPSGREGTADVRIIRALYRSAETGKPVLLGPIEQDARPSLKQEIRRPPVREPRPVHAESPHPKQ